MAQPSEPLDGFWLPASLRESLVDGTWETYQSAGGRTVPPGEGVVVRWPRLTAKGWETLMQRLRAARGPASPDLLERWQRALAHVPEALMRQPDRLEAIASYTGYPVEMLLLAFGQGDLVQLDSVARAVVQSPTWEAARTWQPMPGGLPGRQRFFPARRIDRWSASVRGRAPLFRAAPPATMALGLAAGNVPGNGLLIALLLHAANHVTLGTSGQPPPAVVVRNSRQAPLLVPWVLAAIEQTDPELIQGIGVLVWDYEDASLQRMLLGQTDLVMAAASDQAIASLAAQIGAIGRPIRFLRHGHKVSFAVVGRAALADDPMLVARLAALDSTFWDQYGCLSARVHFVERGGRHSPVDYAAALATAMNELGRKLPRGIAPRRFLHQAYDIYKLLEPDGAVRMLTDYDDDSLVVLDAREWTAAQWLATVNRCAGRVVVVRPVEDIAEVAPRYLRRLPPENLQSISLAIASDRVLDLAEAAGACGVTALRSLGRAAFPRLAYSWDGMLPLDMGNMRCPGHFTTLETDDPLADLAQTRTHFSV